MPFIDLSSPNQNNPNTGSQPVNNSQLPPLVNPAPTPSSRPVSPVVETPIAPAVNVQSLAQPVQPIEEIPSESKIAEPMIEINTKSELPLVEEVEAKLATEEMPMVIETKGPPLRPEMPMNTANTIDNLQKQLDSNFATPPAMPISGSDKLPPLHSILGEEVEKEIKVNQEIAKPVVEESNAAAQAAGLPPLPSLKQEVAQTQNKPEGLATNPPQAENNKTEIPEMPKTSSDFNPMTASMIDFMSYTIDSKASDLHISGDDKPYIRIDGALRPIAGGILTNQKVDGLIDQIMKKETKDKLIKNREYDMSFEHPSGNRFRINIFFKQGRYSLSLRLIGNKIKSVSELKLPNILYEFTKFPQGLVIVTGPTGSGKSTTIAAMIQEINIGMSKHIITIEDPVEYVYPKMKSLVEQRELGSDTLAWKNALRSALRQAPDVVLVGEMRDFETIEATITVAETGHLVFATLHTNSAAQTIDRIIDVFPEGQQNQIRAQLANVITAVIAQRLVKVKSGGRKAVMEILIATPAIKNSIREGKTYQIDNILQTGSDIGMQTLEGDLVRLVRSGELTPEEAKSYTLKTDELMTLLKS